MTDASNRTQGTIEEEEEQQQSNSNVQRHSGGEHQARADSPLLGERSQKSAPIVTSNLPRSVTLVRVSTQSSSIGGIGRQDSNRSRYRPGPVRKLRRRAVLKSGECNVLQSRISKRSIRFLQDIFTTLVDTQWRWTLLCFTLSFVLSWLGFAVIWWLIAFTHGDFDEVHQLDKNWTPCIYNVVSFTSCFLFSIETQHTIGYGGRSTTEECPEAIFVMCIQSISGVMIQAFMVGIVFAKMSRPKQRTQTLLFSKNAVVCQRDGELCFMFRVGDMRKSHIIGATVRAQVIRSRTTKEGELLAQNQQELTVGPDGSNGNIFFIWPTTIVHQIDADSPFYNMTAEDMLTDRFEVVVILEGTIESTGQTTQARSSYLPQEILWGHRFEPVVCYSKERQGYEVDYSLFNSTTQVDTPLCSARELSEFYRVQADELRNATGLHLDDDVAFSVMDNQFNNRRSARAGTGHYHHHHFQHYHHHHHFHQQQQHQHHQQQQHQNHRHHQHQHQHQQQTHYQPHHRLFHRRDSARSEESLENPSSHHPHHCFDSSCSCPSGSCCCYGGYCCGCCCCCCCCCTGSCCCCCSANYRGETVGRKEVPLEDEVAAYSELAELNDVADNSLTIGNSRTDGESDVERSKIGPDHPIEKWAITATKSLPNKYSPHEEDSKCSSCGPRRHLAKDSSVPSSPFSGSRKTLNDGSRKYLLLALASANRSLDIADNYSVIPRRHTGSRERLNLIRRNVGGIKGSKETPEMRVRKFELGKEEQDKFLIESEREREQEQELQRKRKKLDNGEEVAPGKDDNRGTAIGSNESDGGSSTGLEFVARSNIPGHRKSYETAQLRDVNKSLDSSSSSSSSCYEDNWIESSSLSSPSEKNCKPESSGNCSVLPYTSV